MTKSSKIVSIILVVVLCVMFVVSIADTSDSKKNTNFNQTNMMAHIEKISENGPRSIVHKEANDNAIYYIVSQVES